MQEGAEIFWKEHVDGHPDECGDRKEGEHGDDDAGGLLGTIGGGEGLLDEGEFGVGVGVGGSKFQSTLKVGPV